MTDRPANNVDAKQREMYALADGLLSGTITADEAKHLDELLCNDAEARRYYAQYIYDSATFWHWNSANAVQEGDQVVPEEVADGHQTNVGWRTIIDESAEETTAGGTTPRVYASVLYPSSLPERHVAILRDCRAAPERLCLRNLGMGHPRRARDHPRGRHGPPKHVAIAGNQRPRQSGKALDWQVCDTDRLHVARLGDRRQSGRRWHRRSGVRDRRTHILHGSEGSDRGSGLYVAESRDGGYLKVGKLTVYLNQPSEPRSGKPASTYGGQPSPLAGKPQPQTPASGPPPFTIRTPNADFASRDAEFTVSGDPSGGCWRRSPGDALS